MASEKSFHEPKPCANGCGFFGSSATNNLCSKCYRESNLNAVKKHVINTDPFQSKDSKPDDDDDRVTTNDGDDFVTKQQRCGCCNKRVGLTKCRCGVTYCVMHRYPEEHECPFDFKTAGRVFIAKSNPVVRGDKLDRLI